MGVPGLDRSSSTKTVVLTRNLQKRRSKIVKKKFNFCTKIDFEAFARGRVSYGGISKLNPAMRGPRNPR